MYFRGQLAQLTFTNNGHFKGTYFVFVDNFVSVGSNTNIKEEPSWTMLIWWWLVLLSSHVFIMDDDFVRLHLFYPDRAMRECWTDAIMHVWFGNLILNSCPFEVLRANSLVNVKTDMKELPYLFGSRTVLWTGKSSSTRCSVFHSELPTRGNTLFSTPTSTLPHSPTPKTSHPPQHWQQLSIF